MLMLEVLLLRHRGAAPIDRLVKMSFILCIDETVDDSDSARFDNLRAWHHSCSVVRDRLMCLQTIALFSYRIIQFLL